MSASPLVLFASAAPALIRGFSLRPRLGLFPVVVTALCGLWIALLRYALPAFGRRMVQLCTVMSGLMLLSLLPRVLWRGSTFPIALSWFYVWVVLPATVVQVTMLAGLLSAPLWVIAGRLAKRRLKDLPAPAAPLVQTPVAAVPAPLALDLPELRGLPARLRAASQKAGRALRPLVSRRALLTGLPWALPASALVASSYGSLIESRRVVVRRIRLPIVGLPPSLHGLRIGQVTDIHVASLQTQLTHVTRALDLLAAEHPDIICPTGDLCDEPRLHRDVLRLIKQVPARLGHYACLGNHELYLGTPDWVRRSYEHAQIQLLEDESVLLGELRLAAVGYPHQGSSRLEPQVIPSMLDAALAERRPGETTLLLSHHPHVFQHVSGRGVSLQLSGHTHGGQVGLGARSLIEPVYPLARGRYTAQDGTSELFVSAGLGHWLPFRVNCPPEVVIIELVPASA